MPKNKERLPALRCDGLVRRLRLSPAERRQLCHAIEAATRDQEALIEAHTDQWTRKPIIGDEGHVRDWEKQIKEWARIRRKLSSSNTPHEPRP